MDAHTDTRLARILIDEAHQAAARDRLLRLDPVRASDGRHAARVRVARIAGGVAAVLAAAVFLLASWSPAAAAGQRLDGGSAGPLALVAVETGQVQQADPPEKARPASRRTSSDKSDAVAVLAAAVVGAAVVGAIAASDRTSAREREPGQAEGQVPPGHAALSK